MSEGSFDLARFVAAQEDSYEAALSELRRGRKTGHWMWFVFPQIHGLGASAMAQKYAICSLDEARAYLEHPVLGGRLRECAEALRAHPDRFAEEILGETDSMKLRSSMTLFERAAADPAPFAGVLQLFYGGERDPATLARL
ncbi:DUF1810 domain-containing protein [Rubrobacter indicoceani]|uniref:DUF1810 domain-containing protein n=1 Tax=Rubrobacter indicoceani TaxID=2051957 RepID=UPI000E5BC223|nr:DUF1810 domain-containing protein [Rubrobacter indicoceani]